MWSLLFSPDGRIGSDAFMRGATTLIILSIILGLMPLINFQLSLLLSIPGLALFYCWIVLWVKRYRDGGSSGWKCLLPISVWIVVSVIVSTIVSTIFGVDVDQAALDEAVTESLDSGDIGAAFGLMMKSAMESSKALAIPNTLSAAAVSYGIAYVFNKMIRSTPL